MTATPRSPLAELSAQRVTYPCECMDSACDAGQIHEHSRENGRVCIIDTNPRRDAELRKALATERRAAANACFADPAARRCRERSTVERVNARLKDEFGGRHPRVRGHAKAYAHLMFGVIALSVDRLTRLLT